MSVGYRAVGWNRNKTLYDRWLLIGVGLYLAVFIGVMVVVNPDATAETMILRAVGSAALILLHVILCIGPLCRMNPRFLPLLYNRRHMGVTMFALGLVHGGFAIFQYHALGDTNPFVSVLSGVPWSGGIAGLPFQPFGVLGLVILFLMAATSHDFWLANLTAPVWKALHMSVYVAWGALVLHVALGVVQDDRSYAMSGALFAGILIVGFLHARAAHAEYKRDESDRIPDSDGWVYAGPVDDIADSRGITRVIAGERVAIFHWDGKVAALSNVCQHQNGPLGEGRVIDGCVTCPWHGYQYRPEDGRSPPPFEEKVPTFEVRVDDGRIYVQQRPLPAGTRCEPAVVADAGGDRA